MSRMHHHGIKPINMGLEISICTMIVSIGPLISTVYFFYFILLTTLLLIMLFAYESLCDSSKETKIDVTLVHSNSTVTIAKTRQRRKHVLYQKTKDSETPLKSILVSNANTKQKRVSILSRRKSACSM